MNAPVKVEKHYEWSWRCLCLNNKIAASPSLVESLLCDGCGRRLALVAAEWFIEDYPKQDNRTPIKVNTVVQYAWRCPSCGFQEFPGSLDEKSTMSCGMCGQVIEQTGNDQWAVKETEK